MLGSRMRMSRRVGSYDCDLFKRRYLPKESHMMHFQSILLVLTEACHVGCQHCGYIGSKRDGEVDQDELIQWIKQMTTYGVPEIIFTGGEPFERYGVLAAGVNCANNCCAQSSVFTSSYWAKSPAEARSALVGLKGLTRIYLSTDIYHQKRVPVTNVRNAIEAAIEFDISSIILNITYATEADRSYIASQYSDYGNRISIHADRVIPNPKFSPLVLIGQDPLQDLSPAAYSCRCWLGTPLVDPNGDVFSCHIGKAAAHRDISHLPYYLGNLRSLSFRDMMDLAEARSDYQYLRTHGPKGVADMAINSPQLLRNLTTHTFTTACDMCMCVLKSPTGPESLANFSATKHQEIDVRLALLFGEQPLFGMLDSQRERGSAAHAPSVPQCVRTIDRARVHEL